MAREAIPLDPTALTSWHDACLEEAYQGDEAKGLSCLLSTHTGLRNRIVSHYSDDWRVDGSNGQKISLPDGCVSCTIEDGGCRHCHLDRFSCPDGHFMVKKNTTGVGREIPVWDNFMDYHLDESRPTELSKLLDHYFQFNDSFGFSVGYFSQIVKEVAMRRHDIIAEHHQGEVSRQVGSSRQIVPDIKPHDLRATWATQCLRAGIEPEQLMDWAGWSDRTMIDQYRSELNDPSGENTDRYAMGRGNEGVSATEKLNQLRELGIIDEDENLSADELAEVVELLD